MMQTSKRPAKAPTLPAPKKACTEDPQGDLAKQAASVDEDQAIVFAAAPPSERPARWDRARTGGGFDGRPRRLGSGSSNMTARLRFYP